MEPVAEGPLTRDDLERFYALVMDGNEPWQVIGRKLLGEFLGLVANVSDVRAAALDVPGEVDGTPVDPPSPVSSGASTREEQ